MLVHRFRRGTGGYIEPQATTERVRCDISGSTVRPSTRPTLTRATAPRVGAPQFCGSATLISGTTINHTNQPITLEGFEKGATNAWCTLPMLNQTPSCATNNWKVGDGFFGTSVTLEYSVPSSEPKGDWFQFYANVNWISGGGTATCTPYDNPIFPSSHKYACKATWTQGEEPHFPSLTFQIVPATPSSAADPGRLLRSSFWPRLRP